MPPTPRRRSLRDAALAASVGHWVDEVERALDGHLDQGRSLEEESADVVRDALEALVRKKLSDKVVFVETGLFPIEKGDMAAEVPHDTFPDELPRSARKAPEEHGTLEEDLSGLSEADRITLEGILRELEKGRNQPKK